MEDKVKKIEWISGCMHVGEEHQHGLGGSSEAGPKAYLNWLVFKRDGTFMLSQSGYDRLSTAPKEYGQDVAHERLYSPNITITEPGFVYIYLSNEEGSPLEVYFDDFKVTHTIKTPVIQTDDYYPFGLAFNSYQRENSTPNQYKFNGIEEQDELDLGWLDYGARMYIPEIGRWGVIDPLAMNYASSSPYNYVMNNPIIFKDIEGMGPGDTKYTGSGNVVIIISDGPSQWDTSSLNDTEWDYGTFNNLTEARNWLSKTYGRSFIGINNLVIRTHGSVGTNPDGSESGLFILSEGGVMTAKDFDQHQSNNRNITALRLIAQHLNENAKVLLTACGASQLGDKLAKSIFKAFLGDQINLTLFTNGSNTQLGKGSRNTIKVGEHINEKEKQWKPWTVTTNNGSSPIQSIPGLTSIGSFMFFPTGSSGSTSSKKPGLKKMRSPYHPHKPKQNW